MLKIIPLLLSLLFVYACAETEEKSSQPVVAEVKEELVTIESAQREPVYLYGHEAEVQKEISLKINSEPLLLEKHYVSLAGVVSGVRPIVLLDIGGRGRPLTKGQSIFGYKLVEIKTDAIKLSKERNN